MSVFKELDVAIRSLHSGEGIFAAHCKAWRHWGGSDTCIGCRMTVVRLGFCSVSHGACSRTVLP